MGFVVPNDTILLSTSLSRWNNTIKQQIRIRVAHKTKIPSRKIRKNMVMLPFRVPFKDVRSLLLFFCRRPCMYEHCTLHYFMTISFFFCLVRLVHGRIYFAWFALILFGLLLVLFFICVTFISFPSK